MNIALCLVILNFSGDTKLTDWSVDENKINVMKEQFRLEKLQARKKVTKSKKLYLVDHLKCFRIEVV